MHPNRGGVPLGEAPGTTGDGESKELVRPNGDERAGACGLLGLALWCGGVAGLGAGARYAEER
jgi:hypothetical protein